LTRESASGNKQAALEFIKKSVEILVEGVTLLIRFVMLMREDYFGKKMLAQTYLAMEEDVASGHRVARDRITLLLGGNAAGNSNPFKSIIKKLLML
jgi:hypothetical protein